MAIRLGSEGLRYQLPSYAQLSAARASAAAGAGASTISSAYSANRRYAAAMRQMQHDAQQQYYNRQHQMGSQLSAQRAKAALEKQRFDLQQNALDREQEAAQNKVNAQGQNAPPPAPIQNVPASDTGNLLAGSGFDGTFEDFAGATTTSPAVPEGLAPGGAASTASANPAVNYSPYSPRPELGVGAAGGGSVADPDEYIDLTTRTVPNGYERQVSAPAPPNTYADAGSARGGTMPAGDTAFFSNAMDSGWTPGDRFLPPPNAYQRNLSAAPAVPDTYASTEGVRGGTVSPDDTAFFNNALDRGWTPGTPAPPPLPQTVQGPPAGPAQQTLASRDLLEANARKQLEKTREAARIRLEEAGEIGRPQPSQADRDARVQRLADAYYKALPVGITSAANRNRTPYADNEKLRKLTVSLRRERHLGGTGGQIARELLAGKSLAAVQAEKKRAKEAAYQQMLVDSDARAARAWEAVRRKRANRYASRYS